METITNLPMKTPPVDLEKMGKKKLAQLAEGVMDLLNLSGVDMNRATHYNSKEEMEQVRKDLHRRVFELDRSIYGCLFCLPGVTDFARQKAVHAMLGNPWGSNGHDGVLTIDHERKILDYLVDELQANRKLNLFVDLKDGRVNNTRTRNTILRHILNNKNLELWSVKYRQKLNKIFEHAWSVRGVGILRNILLKKRRTQKDKDILASRIDFYLTPISIRRKMDIYKYVSFAIGNTDEDFPLALIYNKAKVKLEDGAKLPPEILEGIRSTYHPTVSRGTVLKATEKTMTSTQKRLVQKSAKKAGVKVKFDPFQANMVELYIYAFEMGGSRELSKALAVKAQKAAASLPFHFDKIGIVVDDSFSMSGAQDQKLRPLAVTLATKDMLIYAGDTHVTRSVSNSDAHMVGNCKVRPSGGTDLATPFLDVLNEDPDAIFVISDGYENQPSGRFAEVLMLVREIGINTPVYHINPVSAAESKGVLRTLSKEVPVLPINNPQTIGLTMFKAMLETDPKNGLLGLVGIALPMIEKMKEVTAG